MSIHIDESASDSHGARPDVSPKPVCSAMPMLDPGCCSGVTPVNVNELDSDADRSVAGLSAACFASWSTQSSVPVSSGGVCVSTKPLTGVKIVCGIGSSAMGEGGSSDKQDSDERRVLKAPYPLVAMAVAPVGVVTEVIGRK